MLAGMRSRICRLFENVVFTAGCAALLCVAAHAASPKVHRVFAPPPLKPLEVLTGGRMLTTPSVAADGFGGRDFTSQWPGSYFRAAFEGSKVFFRVGKSDEILHVTVDEQPPVPLIKPQAGVYEVEGLGSGPHTVSVFVATESQAAPNTFGGFGIPLDEKALAPGKRQRQIEFIGDSHIVGYGDTSAKRQCTPEEIWADTDDTKAFGPVTATHYGADYQVNAISGRGVVRNYNGFRADTLPQAYPYVLFDDKQEYNDPAWKPQVVVIALGTNDFSTPLNPGEPWKTRDELHAGYEATYARFLEKLRTKYPRATIIVWATGVDNGEVETEARKVVEQRKQAGDKQITFLPIDGLSFGACNWHPSLADEKVISEKLIHLIDADKQVWP